MSTAWYFAYGSNMQEATFSGRRGIAFHRAVPACADGWRLVLDKPPLIAIGESFANIIAEPTAEVWGVAYEIDSTDLAHIDLTEGVLIGNYQRIEIPVVAGATALRAFTLTSEKRDATLQPSTRYIGLLIAGAEEHGLPGEYIDFLRAIPAQPESPRAAELRPFIDNALRRS